MSEHISDLSYDPNEPNEAFYIELDSYLKEYETLLADKFSKSTIRNHSLVIGSLIEYVCIDLGVTGMEEITLGMCGSKFTRWFNSHCDESFQTVTVKNILKSFFEFIYTTHGIRNEKLLNALQKK